MRVRLPSLRLDQLTIKHDPHPLKVVRCGRRYGKTYLLRNIAGEALSQGKLVGVYAPQFATLEKTYQEILGDVEEIVTSKNSGHRMYSKHTKGEIDFWSLESGLFGRGREYDVLLFDEAAFTKDNTLDIYMNAISPVLATRPNHQVYAFSTPEDIDLKNFFYALHNHKRYKWINGGTNQQNASRFKVFHRPTHMNPLVTAEYLAQQKASRHPLSWQQEFLAEFVNWDGVSLFANLEYPEHHYPSYDYVFCVVDTAQKDNIQHDGCAVMYFGYSEVWGSQGGAFLHILDWDIRHIHAGDPQELWMREINEHGQALANDLNAREGWIGAAIEDKASGTGLLHAAVAAGLPCFPIPSQLTAMGKDLRAGQCRDIVWRNEVKFTKHSYHKTVDFKNENKNHAKSQVMGFRMGDVRASVRADDLLDTFTYGTLLSNPRSQAILSLSRWN